MMVIRKDFKIRLNDLSNDELSKNLLFQSISRWLSEHKEFNITLIGSDQQILATRRAMLESKKFQNELFSQEATLDSIFERLEKKNIVAETFKNVVGVLWAL